jgi:hypothetical protein
MHLMPGSKAILDRILHHQVHSGPSLQFLILALPVEGLPAICLTVREEDRIEDAAR